MEKTIKCKDCGYEEEFEDNGVNVDCMPDGCLVEDSEWICQDCCIKRGLLDANQDNG